jgi:MFS family permease
LSFFLDDRRRQIQAIAAATSCIGVVGIGLSLSIPLLAFAMEGRGVSGTMIGLNTAMAGIATIAVAPFIPRLAALLGVRSLIFWALALGAVTFIAFWYAQPFWLWFPLRFLMGVSLAVLFVLSEFWINAAAPEKARGLVMGIYATVLSLGFAAGPTILALFDRNSITPYLIAAALFVGAALPVAFAGGLAPKIEKSAKTNFVGYLLAAPSAIAAAFVFGAVETGGMSFLPLYGLRMGYSEVSAAMLVSILAMGNVLVQIPLGFISDKVDRHKLLLLLGIVGAVGAALMPLIAHRTEILFPVVAIWGGLIAGLYTVGLAHLGAQFQGAPLAGANATFIMLYSLGMLAGPPLMGAGLDIWNPHGLPFSIAILFVLYVVVVAIRLRMRGSSRRKPAMAAKIP